MGVYRLRLSQRTVGPQRHDIYWNQSCKGTQLKVHLMCIAWQSETWCWAAVFRTSGQPQSSHQKRNKERFRRSRRMRTKRRNITTQRHISVLTAVAVVSCLSEWCWPTFSPLVSSSLHVSYKTSLLLRHYTVSSAVMVRLRCNIGVQALPEHMSNNIISLPLKTNTLKNT